MTGWNYRIIKHDTEKNSYFAIHEVHYDAKGEVELWTLNPVSLVGESKTELMKDLKMNMGDCKMPILIESELIDRIKKSKNTTN